MSNDMFHPRHNSGMIEVREVEHEKPMDSLFFGDGDRHSDRTRAGKIAQYFGAKPNFRVECQVARPKRAYILR